MNPVLVEGLGAGSGGGVIAGAPAGEAPGFDEPERLGASEGVVNFPFPGPAPCGPVASLPPAPAPAGESPAGAIVAKTNRPAKAA